MRNLSHICYLVIFLTLACLSVRSQTVQTIHVSGKYILGPCNDTLLLKGVNYAPYNWGWSPTQLKLNQVVLSGANCVRMPWYVNTPDGPTPQATYNNLVYLDSALSKCVQYKMIPIIELHDETCNNNPANLIALANWYVQPAVKLLINKYKHSIILNIANEALWVSWASNPTTAQTTFTNTYNTIVNTIRSNSITVPIMIDGSECGTNLDVLANVGQSLLSADPASNLIFSAHAYWNTYAGNDSLQALAKINYALSKNIPFIFGEVANLQDGSTLCQYTLNYKPWLNILKQKKIGWLAWSWDNDGCAARQITTNGNFSSLTSYGNDIINNSNYGLANGTIKSKYLVFGGCGSPPVSAFSNPSYGCTNVPKLFTDNSSNIPSSWSWSVTPLTGVTINLPSSQNPTITFSNVGSYTVSLKASNSFGQGNIITHTLNVSTNPVVTISNSIITICKGSTAAISASGASTYTWSSGPTTSSISVNPMSTTIYSVTGAINSCSTIKTATIIVNSTPTVSVSNTNLNPCKDDVITLTSSGANSYTWMPTNTIGPVLNYTATSTQIFTVVGSFTNGCSTSFTYQVLVTICTALNELTEALYNVSIYPNPTYDHFYISNSYLIKTISMYDPLNRNIPIQRKDNEFLLPQLANGIYYIKLVTTSGQTITRRIAIKNK